MKKTLKILSYTIIAFCLFTSINAGQDPQKNQLPNYDDFQIVFGSELNTLLEAHPIEQAISYLFAPQPIHEQPFMNFGIAAEPNPAQLFFNPFSHPMQHPLQSALPIVLSTGLHPNPITTPRIATSCTKRKQTRLHKETGMPWQKKVLRHAYSSDNLLKCLKEAISYKDESSQKHTLRIPIPGEKEEIAKALTYLRENVVYGYKKQLYSPCLEPLCNQRVNKSLGNHAGVDFSLEQLIKHLKEDCHQLMTAYTCQNCKEVFNYFSLLAHHHLTKHNGEITETQGSNKQSFKE